MKLSHKRSLGLSGGSKLLLLALVVAVLGLVAQDEHLGTDVFVPLINVHVGSAPSTTCSCSWWSPAPPTPST